MVDITKDEFWENKYEEVNKKKKKDNRLRRFINNNKWIILLITSFLLLAISNGCLIYNFVRVLRKL